jgi:hypothetical protein
MAHPLAEMLMARMASDKGAPSAMPDDSGDQGDMGDEALGDAWEALMHSFKDGDKEAGCTALKAAFQSLDAEPHEEGPHEEPEPAAG